jgi:hypothetical protein
VDFATADADGDGSVSYQEAVRRRCGGGERPAI